MWIIKCHRISYKSSKHKNISKKKKNFIINILSNLTIEEQYNNLNVIKSSSDLKSNLKNILREKNIFEN